MPRRGISTVVQACSIKLIWWPVDCTRNGMLPESSAHCSPMRGASAGVNAKCCSTLNIAAARKAADRPEDRYGARTTSTSTRVSRACPRSRHDPGHSDRKSTAPKQYRGASCVASLVNAAPATVVHRRSGPPSLPCPGCLLTDPCGDRKGRQDRYRLPATPSRSVASGCMQPDRRCAASRLAGLRDRADVCH